MVVARYKKIHNLYKKRKRKRFEVFVLYLMVADVVREMQHIPHNLNALSDECTHKYGHKRCHLFIIQSARFTRTREIHNTN